MTAPKPDGLLTDDALLAAMVGASAPYDSNVNLDGCTMLTPDEMRTGLRAVEARVRARMQAEIDRLRAALAAQPEEPSE